MSKRINKIIERRMLAIKDQLIHTGVVRNQKEFCKEIGLHYTCLYQIRDGRQCFTHAQIIRATKLSGKTIDYVYGLKDQ